MDEQSRHEWKRALATAAWASAATLPILAVVTTGSGPMARAVGWLLFVLGLWLWRELRSGRPLIDAVGLAALALAPALWLELNSYLGRWPGLHGALPGSPWTSVPAHAIASAVVSASLVRASGRREGALSIAGFLAPTVMALWAFARLIHHGPTRLGLGLLLLAAATFVLATVALRRRWGLSAFAVAGLAALLLLPAIALAFYELAYNFEDWPCSSMNLHLRVHPWLRMLTHATSLGLIAAAGGEVLRRRAWLLAVPLIAGSLVVQVPASYSAYRSGCGGEVGQGFLFWPRPEDPGCQGQNGCYCDVRYDRLGRPELLRADDAPLRLWLPVWLLNGSRADVRYFLLHQESEPLPVERCRR